jgi:hypothetical protein
MSDEMYKAFRERFKDYFKPGKEIRIPMTGQYGILEWEKEYLKDHPDK